MNRRNFLLNFLFSTLSFAFGYKVGNSNTKSSSVLSEELAPNEKKTTDIVTPEMYGANGGDNDSAAFQAANDFLASKGGGTLLVPEGTWFANFILDSHIILKGSGVNTTVIKSVAGSNKDVIQSRDFSTYTGRTSSTENEGLRYSQIRDISIDGNKQNNTAGFGIRVWGCWWNWENVVVQNCVNDGIWTEFSTIESPTINNFIDQLLESRFTNIKTVFNDGNGWTYHGPHDSIVDNYVAVKNANYAFYQEAPIVAENFNCWLNGNGIYVGDAMNGHDIVNDAGSVGIEFKEGIGSCKITNLRVGNGEIGAIIRGDGHIISGDISGSNISVIIDKLSRSILNISGMAIETSTCYFDVISETTANNITALINIPNTIPLKKGNFRSDDYIAINTSGTSNQNLFQFNEGTLKAGGWTFTLPHANGTILTDEVAPTSTKRGGIKQQTNIPDLTVAPTMTDFNNLLAKLRNAGVLSSTK